MVKPFETLNQRTRRVLGARLHNRWPNVRPNPRPRGLRNPGVSCYRNSGLQLFAHLPRFVNWIMEHNEENQNWPCREGDPNREFPVHQEKDKVILGMDRDLITGCVSCRLKAFFRDYWDDEALSSDQTPSSFDDDRPSVLPLHRLGERWNCNRPYAKKGQKTPRGIGERADVQRRLDPETARERNARRSRAIGQNCAQEYLSRLLQGVAESINPA